MGVGFVGMCLFYCMDLFWGKSFLWVGVDFGLKLM